MLLLLTLLLFGVKVMVVLAVLVFDTEGGVMEAGTTVTVSTEDIRLIIE